MSITYKLNKEKNGVEIKFTEKPSEKVRGRLKELGFRWSQFNGVWYAKQSEETVAYAKELAAEEGEQIMLNFPVEEPTAMEEEIAKVEKKLSEKPIPKKVEKKAEPKKVVDKHKTASKPQIPNGEKSEEAEAPKKDNIVIFPAKGRPNVKTAITSGNATYEDCEAKLSASKKAFCDSENMGIIEALLNRCEIDANFRNNVMRADKTYKGAFDYIIYMAKEGYAYKYNDMNFLDTELSTAFAIDYFNGADLPENLIAKIKKEG